MIAQLLRPLRLAGLAAVLITASVARGAAADAPFATIHVAITNINYDAVPILYALKTGAFQKAGLDVQLQRLASGSAITAAVAGGSVDIGKSSASPIITAIGRGIPLILIAPGAVYDEKAPNGALVVLRDSPFRTAADMNGKFIGTQTLNDIAQTGTESWLDEHGGDSKTVRWVELPMTAAVAALEEGRIAGGVLTSPILDEALATGKTRILGPILSGVAPHFLFSVYFTTKEWAAAHRAEVKTFASVIIQSAAYTNVHHAEMIPLIAELMGATQSAVAHMTWPTGGTAVRAQDVQPVIDIGVKYKAIQNTYSAQDAIFK
jgi:NitT/TauT family transport system substrate-binding protein